MTVIAVPQAPPIVCPSWCVVPQRQHVDDLADAEGVVLHRTSDADAAVLPAASLELLTYVDGTPLPDRRPRIYLNQAAANTNGMLPSDARYLAEEILAAVEEAQR